MIDFNDITKKIKENNPSWPQTPEHPYRKLIIGGSGFGKTNASLNLISDQSHTDITYAKDPYEVKYQYQLANAKV